jgi:hypothetical protein
MSKAGKYQRFAEACLEIASSAKDDKIKAALTWRKSAATGSEPNKRDRKRRSQLGLALSLSLICELSPSLRHFVENTLMTLISGLIGQPHGRDYRWRRNES